MNRIRELIRIIIRAWRPIIGARTAVVRVAARRSLIVRLIAWILVVRICWSGRSGWSRCGCDRLILSSGRFHRGGYTHLLDLLLTIDE